MLFEPAEIGQKYGFHVQEASNKTGGSQRGYPLYRPTISDMSDFNNAHLHLIGKHWRPGPLEFMVKMRILLVEMDTTGHQ